MQSEKRKVKASGAINLESVNLESVNLEKLHADLLAWYATHKRDLPWRQTRDPYKILLSEVLLQQTQVSRGLEYYSRFLEVFPTVHTLAKAPVEAVLKAWEGAGYYARARNLHRAAQLIAEHGMPDSLEGFLALPGIGRYTAGAVSSIALRLPEPLVDGNVRRVLARWLLEPNPQEDWLWSQAEALLEHSQPGEWNQAIMELGATVCAPKHPSCASCPVSSHCQAFLQDRVTGTPAPKIRAKVKEIRAVALVAGTFSTGTGGRFLLEQRPKKGLLGGLHGFPLLVIDLDSAESDPNTALERLLARFGLESSGAWLGAVSHTMTHRQLEVQVYAMMLESGLLVDPRDVALSKLDQKILSRATRVNAGQVDSVQTNLF
jgi:A/G-specific adenine glycosylase